MYSTMKFVLVALAAVASAAPAVEKRQNSDCFATFYSDTACTQDGGSAVDTTNPGCLDESNRHSIYFQSCLNTGHSLIFSPEAGCNCQNDCLSDVDDGDGGYAYCLPLDGTADALSFRFISGGCPPNNC